MARRHASVCSLADEDYQLLSSLRTLQLEARSAKTIQRIRWSPLSYWQPSSLQLHTPNSGWEFLVRGHHVNITNDASHHLLQERRVENIRSATLLKVVLGMLNTGRGGRVLLGISEGGVVEGVRMTLHQRDSLMLGVSQCLKGVRPSVLPCDELVQFIRVEGEDEGPSAAPARGDSVPAQPLASHDYYVVIITVRPSVGEVYRSSESADLVLRDGAANVTLQGPLLGAYLRKEQQLRARHLRAVALQKRNLAAL